MIKRSFSVSYFLKEALLETGMYVKMLTKACDLNHQKFHHQKHFVPGAFLGEGLCTGWTKHSPSSQTYLSLPNYYIENFHGTLNVYANKYFYS